MTAILHAKALAFLVHLFYRKRFKLDDVLYDVK